MLQNASLWSRLFLHSLNCFFMVQTASLCPRLFHYAPDCFFIVQTVSPFSRLFFYGPNCFFMLQTASLCSRLLLHAFTILVFYFTDFFHKRLLSFCDLHIQATVFMTQSQNNITESSLCCRYRVPPWIMGITDYLDNISIARRIIQRDKYNV